MVLVWTRRGKILKEFSIHISKAKMAEVWEKSII